MNQKIKKRLFQNQLKREVINISTDAIERSKIFVWGDYGQVLKDMDSKRIHAIAQVNPDRFLAIISNCEIDLILDLILNKELPKDFEKMIMELESKDTMFKEIAKFLSRQTDMLSVGSFLTGEKESNKAFMQVFNDGESDE